MSKPLILFVDDDPTMLELAAAILVDKGYEVLTSDKASSAISLFNEHGERVALVLIDAKLPGLDGPGLRRILQQMHPNVKCAYVTGMDEHPNGDGATVPAIFKPFQVAALLKLVRDQIGEP